MDADYKAVTLGKEDSAKRYKSKRIQQEMEDMRAFFDQKLKEINRKKKGAAATGLAVK